jgi:hypothetical protein
MALVRHAGVVVPGRRKAGGRKGKRKYVPSGQITVLSLIMADIARTKSSSRRL